MLVFSPFNTDANANKHSGRYLIGIESGIQTNRRPQEFKYYIDASFESSYTKNCKDLKYVKSRTGCVITYAGCTIA